jgi:hypothetical protein
VNPATFECECDGDYTYFNNVDPERCGDCTANCEDCDEERNCTDCHLGYFEDDTMTPIGCTVCSKECAECSGPENSDCSACKPEYYLQPGTTICEDFCPTLTTKDDTTHVCNDSVPNTLCFEFDDKTFELTDDTT